MSGDSVNSRPQGVDPSVVASVRSEVADLIDEARWDWEAKGWSVRNKYSNGYMDGLARAADLVRRGGRP